VGQKAPRSGFGLPYQICGRTVRVDYTPRTGSPIFEAPGPMVGFYMGLDTFWATTWSTKSTDTVPSSSAVRSPRDFQSSLRSSYFALAQRTIVLITIASAAEDVYYYTFNRDNVDAP